MLLLHYNNNILLKKLIIVIYSDAPIMIFRGRFRYRFFSSKLADSDSDTDFFPLSNQQEIMKDSNTNKVVI